MALSGMHSCVPLMSHLLLLLLLTTPVGSMRWMRIRMLLFIIELGTWFLLSGGRMLLTISGSIRAKERLMIELTGTKPS